MIYRNLYTFIFLTYTCILQPYTGFTQSNILSKPEMEEALMNAKKLMIAKQGEKSTKVTSLLINQLKKQGEYNSHFGFKVRLIHGMGLINSTTTVPNYDFLLRLKDESRKFEEWAVLADVCREMARVQEFSGQSEEAYKNLLEAEAIIQSHQLDSLYSSFAVRKSSWHRIYGEKDSAIYYAEEALKFAPKFKQVFEEAEGNFLLSLIFSKIDSDKTLSHYKKAAYLYLQVGDYYTFTVVQSSIARLLLKKNELKAAMQHADSSILYSTRFLNSDPNRIQHGYKVKGDIFQQLGQLDSALVYLRKGYESQLQMVAYTRKDLLQEIDKKYNVVKTIEKLEAEKERNLLLSIIILFALLLSTTIYFYYNKLKKTNQRIQQQAEELKSLDLLKSRFFANVSHELRTPLSLIKGPINHLRNENKSSTQNQYLLDQALVNIKHLENLVNQVLDLQKLEMGKMELIVEPTDLNSFFGLQIAQFESLAQQKEIIYTSHIAVSEGQVAELDQEKCRQVIYNLLSNAFKFTPSGGKVSVNIRLQNSSLMLSVEDTGAGIHPDDLQHVFTRFFQVTKTDIRAMGGTGIGLSLCYEYAKLFNGAISAESQVGEGTVFYFSFPIQLVDSGLQINSHNHMVKDEWLGTSSVPDKTTSGANPAKQTILVVEDNAGLQNYLNIILSEKYNVLTADHGKKALDILAHRQDIDLILSDIMMPVMDGYELLQQLKSSDTTRHIPVVMLTARAEKDDKLKALRIGVDDYITKPFEEEELIVRVGNLLKNLSIRRNSELDENNKFDSTDSLFSAEDLDWLERFESYVKANISSESFTVKVLADEFAMSESTLLRLLKRMTGMTTAQYILEIRLNEAYHLFETKAYNTISTVAAKVGYNDARSLTRKFKERFGKSPSDMIEETL